MKAHSSAASSRSSEPWLMKTWPALVVTAAAPYGTPNAPTKARSWQWRSGERLGLSFRDLHDDPGLPPARSRGRRLLADPDGQRTEQQQDLAACRRSRR